MRSLKLFFLVAFTIFNSSLFSQDKLLPPNAEITDSGLKKFLLNLEEAVKSKNKEFIINNMSPHIQTSFGGDGGIEEFKAYWNWSSDESEFWRLMEKLLKLGGDRFKGGDRYFIPYIFSSWPGHEKYDVFTHEVITGSNVNVRDKPNIGNSNILGQLSYDIVKVNYEKSYPPFNTPRIENVTYIGQKLWYYVESLDGELKGYVYWNYIWSPIGYRLGLTYQNGKWEINYLIAGD